MEFPRYVYICPGRNNNESGFWYDFVSVNNEKELKARESEGYFLTVAEAAKAVGASALKSTVIIKPRNMRFRKPSKRLITLSDVFLQEAPEVKESIEKEEETDLQEEVVLDNELDPVSQPVDEKDELIKKALELGIKVDRRMRTDSIKRLIEAVAQDQ